MTKQEKNLRREKTGTVIANKMNKTVVVSVERTIQHPKYRKVITVKKKYYVHNEKESLTIGDRIAIVETRPISKLKRWRVKEKMNSVK